MDLLSFVRSLPKGWAYTPIYGFGVRLPEGKRAKGKEPQGSTWHENLDAEETALRIEREPDKFKAVGVWTGSRSNGLVIFDVDENLGAIHKKWGKELKNAPRIDSPKKNAAKYLFTVPKNLWLEVADISHAGSKHEGWEVLWGRQGVIGGDYKDNGEYTLNGDLTAVPEAPGWLLARMKESYQQKKNKSSPRTLKDTRWSARSKEERVVIASSCLSVIEPQGRGSEDLWWRIGAMIHSELPGDEGLNLWREWSLKDDEYTDDWKDNNDPCLDRWQAGFNCDGGLGFGSLVALADSYDPERARFHRDGCHAVFEEVMSQPALWRRATLSFEEVIRRAKTYLEMDNPAEMNFNLNNLAIDAGYRDQFALEKLIVDQIEFEGAKGTMTADQLLKLDQKRDYLIPDVLPHPSVVLVYGAGGDGKSMSAWTLAKHISLGSPFVVRGKYVPVQQGPVLLLNGDQPLIQLKEQLEEVDYPLDSKTYIQTDWSLQRYAQFIKLMNDVKPKLVVIDSLIGCSGGRAFDENKSDFATPLYWLTRNNGVLFPAATILIIHHANKQGGFRGTSAIRDAVDETWALSKPSKEQLDKGSVPQHSRLITIEKSRSGRSGTSLIMRQEDDLSFSVADFTPEQDKSNTAPASVTDRVLARLRTIYPRTYSRTDLNSDPTVGGQTDAIRKSLQRLVKRGLVEVAGSATSPDGKSTFQVYKAVLACGAFRESVPQGENTDAGTDLRWDTQTRITEVSQRGASSEATVGQPSKPDGACPRQEPSGKAESDPVGHSEIYPRAREECAERTDEELDALRNKAWNQWDV